MSGPNNHTNSNTSSNNHSNLPAGIVLNPNDSAHHRVSSPVSPSRPGSSDGSTTVSATSSPGIDQQEEREHTLKMKMRIPELAYKVVEDMYNKQSQQQQHPTSSNSSSKTTSASSQHSNNAHLSASSSTAPQLQKQHSTTSGSSNGSTGGGLGGAEDVSPRKKPRKQNMWVYFCICCLTASFMDWFLCNQERTFESVQKKCG